MIPREPLRTRRRAEHDMAMPAIKRRWSRAEVLALVEDSPLHSPRYEVVDGALLVTPSPGGPHQVAVGLLFRALAAYCDETKIGEALIAPFDTELEAGTLVQPDVFVVPPEEAARLRRERTARSLTLAVEVLSPGSERADRQEKRALYQRTVPEYWLVDVDERLVERWVMGVTQPEIIADRLTWRPQGAAVPFTLFLHELFARVWGE
jgi:Uma2 family endonuclease